MKVLVFPRDPGSNPYQKLLYDQLQKEQVEIEYLEYSIRNLLLLPLILSSKYREGFRILHLHWPNFYVYKKIRFVKFASFLLSSYCIRAIRFSRLKLVWTVHNVLPHQSETSNDLAIAKYLAKHSSAKILHSKFTIEQMRELSMDTSNCHIVPHGNYEGVYPNNVTAKAARKKLGIDKAALVILFFGTVKEYKGVDSLINTFEKLDKQNVWLVIAGKCTEEVLKRKISEAAKRSGRIIFHPGFVTDDNVATYFQASDIVCLPFKSITTSGSALLALTLHRPLIAPATGALLDIPEVAGFFYNPLDINGLAGSLKLVIDNPKLIEDKVVGAGKYVSSISWNKVALQTKKVYDLVL